MALEVFLSPLLATLPVEMEGTSQVEMLDHKPQNCGLMENFRRMQEGDKVVGTEDQPAWGDSCNSQGLLLTQHGGPHGHALPHGLPDPPMFFSSPVQPPSPFHGLQNSPKAQCVCRLLWSPQALTLQGITCLYSWHLIQNYFAPGQNSPFNAHCLDHLPAGIFDGIFHPWVYPPSWCDANHQLLPAGHTVVFPACSFLSVKRVSAWRGWIAVILLL